MTYGLLAQQAERHPVKVRVAGSIPAGTANRHKGSTAVYGGPPCDKHGLIV